MFIIITSAPPSPRAAASAVVVNCSLQVISFEIIPDGLPNAFSRLRMTVDVLRKSGLESYSPKAFLSFVSDLVSQIVIRDT